MFVIGQVLDASSDHKTPLLLSAAKANPLCPKALICEKPMPHGAWPETFRRTRATLQCTACPGGSREPCRFCTLGLVEHFGAFKTFCPFIGLAQLVQPRFRAQVRGHGRSWRSSVTCGPFRAFGLSAVSFKGACTSSRTFKATRAAPSFCA